MGFATGIGSALALATEVFTIVLIFVGLLIATPFAAMVALVYFGISGLVLQRMIRQRVRSAAERNQAASRVTSTASLQALGAFKEIKLRRAEDQFVVRYRRARHEARARPGIGDPAQRAAEVPPRDRLRLRDRAPGVRGDDASGTPSRASSSSACSWRPGAGSCPARSASSPRSEGVRFSRPPLEHLIRENRMQVEAEREQLDRQRTTEVPRGDIAVDHVTFAYADQPDALVLKGVDARIPVGRSIAVVGLERGRQDHPRRPGPRSARASRGDGHRGRHVDLRQPAGVAGAAGRGAPGRLPPRRHPAGQHHLRPAAGRRPAGRRPEPRAAHRPGGGDARGPRQRGRRARCPPLGWPAAADRHRPGAVPQPASCWCSTRRPRRSTTRPSGG